MVYCSSNDNCMEDLQFKVFKFVILNSLTVFLNVTCSVRRSLHECLLKW